MTETIIEAPARELSDVHRSYLLDHAILNEVISAHGIWSSGDRIVFPWQDGEQCTSQRRVWPEPESGLPDGVGKYLWEKEEPLHFAAWRPLAGDGPVIIAEGTKQSLAVASWAPPEYAVYGMPGCDIGRVARLQQAGLNRFSGHRIIVMLDADATDNMNVYEGGEKLAELLDLEGAAEIAFTRLPAQGTDGIDDFLASVPEERRTEMLAKLIARAQPKPAERKPTRRKIGDQLPDTGGRPMVVVNKDRLAVILEILGHMQQKWNGVSLFCYGNVLTRLRGSTTEPLDKDSLVRWMAEAVATFRYKPPSATAPGTYEAAWPEPQTIGALLASGDQFAPLAGISRTPFARPDGSICFKNGWDYDPDTGAGSQVMLVTGNSGMDRLDIPGSPGQDEAGAAARYLLGTWLGDMPWRDNASRANALALILTPFLRGIVPLVPLAVISGLQMGVGKNLLADCISLMTSGENVQPLPWIADDDDEVRKQILSSFRAGSSLVCFDEAHVLGGPALTRAITATTYADRILGVSKMASYPNRVTWMALGNQVSVLADMARRTYYIELYPEGPDPQDRDESAFTIPDLRTWTTGNRPELVTAALTLIRAWFAAGCPACPRGSLMGSFEPWDKIMSGILGYAGVGGFLTNLGARRAERDTTGRFWTDHLAWLREKFGTGEFTALNVKTKAMASGGDWDAPPRLDEAGDRGFTRNLGLAYAHNQDRWYGPLRIVKAGMAAGTKGLWQVQARDEDIAGSVLHPLHTSPGSQGNIMSDLGEMKEMKGEWPQDCNKSGFPETGGVDEVDEVDEVTNPICHAHAPARAHAHMYTREGVGSSPVSFTSFPPWGLGFDLETGSAGDLFTYTPHDDTGFVRLAGLIGAQGTMITDAGTLLNLLPGAAAIIGHNILGFDGLALAWHHRRDDPGWWESFAAKARDTELIARQVWPPQSRQTHSDDKLGLDNVAELLGLPGKTDDLKRLKAKFGGYDQIPPDDPEYRSYLEGDLRATAAVAERLLGHYDTDPYLTREHQVAAVNGRMSLNGFRVDQDLLTERLAAGEERKQVALQILNSHWDLPLGKMKARGRGKNKREEFELAVSPLSTDYGRDWLAAQWERYGITDPPRTEKTGKLALGAEDLKRVADDPGCPGELKQMLQVMEIITTTRTVYQTAQSCLCTDGRVHPSVSMRQASGRSSVTNPGLTVFGKHGGKHVERDIFIPDPGFVLMSFDLSQVDMRAVAGHSQDPAYMALFAPGRDAHAEIAAMLGITRQQAKAYGHGWNYGLGPNKMIANGNDPETVYAFVHGMESRFPRLIAWREEIRDHAKAGGILGNGFGRRMRADPQYAHTVAPALMGQGTAADILKTWMLACPRELDKYRLVTVHDEQVFQFPEEDWQEMAREVMRASEGEFMGVPILCDQSGPGKSWGEISAK